MLLSNFWKNLPAFVRMPMLYASLGLHGLLLMVPIPSQPDPEPSARKQESVKITQLPSQPSPNPSPTVQQPIPAPTVQPSVSASRPPVKALPERSLIVESPKPSPRVQQTAPKRSPIIIPLPTASPSPTTTPLPTARATPTPTPTPVASPTPTPTPTPIASPTPTPTPIASPTPTPSPSSTYLVAGVPHLDNAQPACNGLCMQIPAIPFRSASKTLVESLEEGGYAVEKQDIADDTGRSVYKVTKDGKTQFLSVLPTDNGDTLYLLAERELTREELIRMTAL